MPLGFQPNAFQGNAFQSAYQVVAGDYALGSPTFATPAVTEKIVFAAAAYSLGSPAFARPALGQISLVLHANAYSLGSPSIAIAGPIRQINRLNASAYSTASPVFATVGPVGQNYRLRVNLYATGSPAVATPLLIYNYQLHPQSYSISAIGWPPQPPAVLITALVHANAYWTQSPRFNYPRLQWQLVVSPVPPTYYSQAEAASNMLIGLLDILSSSIPPVVSTNATTARRLIATLRANADAAIRGETIGTQLQQIYAALNLLGPNYGAIERARQYLMGFAADASVLTQIVFRAALIMDLAVEAQILVAHKYTTRNDVQQAIRHVQTIFEQAKAIGIDEVDALVYQTLTALGGATVNALASLALQLPRFVEYDTRMPMPSLYLAQRIYRDPTRSDEIEQENSIVHPGFCPTALRVLSNIGV